MTSSDTEPIAPWTAVDWTGHEHDVIVGRRRLHFVDIGSGPVILLIHGLGMSWQCWLENIPALALEHRVIAVDVPGFGDSEPAAVPAIGSFADTLAELAAALGVPELTVVGHSMGGVIGERMAIDHPGLVSRLMLVCPGDPSVGRLRLAGLTVAFWTLHALLARRRAAATYLRSPRIQRRVMAGFVADGASVSPALAAEMSHAFRAPGFGAALLACRQDTTIRAVGRIGCPTLVVWGAQDRVMPVSCSAVLAEHIPDVRVEVWPDVGHAPMVERPAEFNALLRTFAARRAAGWASPA